MSELSTIKRELEKGKTVMSFTEGDSMKPLLYHKSTCVIIVGVNGSLKSGELPLYQRPNGQFVMHRIIKTDSENYYTRGDNRCGLERVPKKWVIGVVTEIKRKNKTIKVTDKSYLRYVKFWNFIYPLRMVWYKIRGKIRKRGIKND